MHNKIDSVQEFHCKRCSKIFTSQSNLNIHILSSKKCNEQYKCFDCNLVFASGYNLKRHLTTPKHKKKAIQIQSQPIQTQTEDFTELTQPKEPKKSKEPKEPLKIE